MAKTFHLTIAKVGENLYDGDVISVSLPGSEGTFQILAEHEAFVSELVPGTIRVKDAADQEHKLVIPDRGIAEVSSSQATVLL